MGTEKRERQKAARAARLEAERKAAARQRQIRSVRNIVLVGVGIIVLLLVLGKLTGCSSTSSDGTAAATTTTEPSSSKNAAGAVSYGDGACPAATGAKRTIRFAAAPKRCIDSSKTYTATIDTTLGTATVRLDTKRTPLTTNNFVVLARYGFYDDTALFRTESNTGIIQGGSPATENNLDPGPGYTIPDEGGIYTAKDYSAGTLAMARTEAPNSGGGQFFLLASNGAKYLADPAQAGSGAGTYVAFGTTTKGLDVLQRIAALDSGDGHGTPTTTPKIKTVSITES
jgi:peptidyl-prolyl cis-trans isomerase B (cyclophilin B)